MSRLLFNISLSEYCNIYWKGWITYGSLIDVNATENRAEKKWWKKGIKSESEWTRAYEWERGAELKSWTRQICNVWFVDSLFDFAFLCQHSWLQFVCNFCVICASHAISFRCTHSNVQNIEHDHNMRHGMFPSRDF